MAFIRATIGLFLVLVSYPSFASTESQKLPQRLVLALDGVPYELVSRLQQEGRAFVAFNPASRLISTFPSISDSSWSDIFGTIPPDGYQRYRYSRAAERRLGGALTDLSNPLEYEKQMHFAFEDVFHHLGAYAAGYKAAKAEIRTIAEEFLNSKDTEVFYAYMLATDTVQHIQGEVESVLLELDQALVELQATYFERTGKQLEITIVSDHGNNGSTYAKRVPVRKTFKENGYRIPKRLKDEKDVAYPFAGILGGIPVYVAESQVEQVAALMAKVEGVDIVTNTAYQAPDQIIVRDANGNQAVIRKRPDGDEYTYQMRHGDPLGYANVVAQMHKIGKMDADGYASAEAWLKYTATLDYPAAVERIYRGHHVLTTNPSPILVSFKDGYEIAEGVLKFLSIFKKRGGTHGGLAASCSNGVFMTNFMPTVDTTTNRVRHILEFTSTKNYREEEQYGGSLLDMRALALEEDADYWFNSAPVVLHFWDYEAKKLAEQGISTRYSYVIRRDGALFFNPVDAQKQIPEESTTSEIFKELNENERIVFFKDVAGKSYSKGEYFFTIFAHRVDSVTGKSLKRVRLFTDRFFVDSEGSVRAN